MATTVTTKPNWAAAVSAVVGVAVSTLLYFWTKVDVGWVVAFTLPISYAYHWLIAEGEKKFPWLSVFFLALPSNLPTPAVTPTPVQQAPYVETDKGVWAADVNAMAKADAVANTPVAPVTSTTSQVTKPKPTSTSKPKPKTKR